MFIFSQFNFPDPKPRVSEGDWRSPGRLGVGAAVAQKQSESREGIIRGEARERGMHRKEALDPGWKAGGPLSTMHSV